jgi:hypothetical protein
MLDKDRVLDRKNRKIGKIPPNTCLKEQKCSQNPWSQGPQLMSHAWSTQLVGKLIPTRAGSGLADSATGTIHTDDADFVLGSMFFFLENHRGWRA